MPGLVPGIHVLSLRVDAKAWMAGTSPAMTTRLARADSAHSRASGNPGASCSGFWVPAFAGTSGTPLIPRERNTLQVEERYVASPAGRSRPTWALGRGKAAFRSC
jgi:hypothetical protein